MYFCKQAIITNKYILLCSRNSLVKRAHGFGLAWAVGGPASAAPSGPARSLSPFSSGSSGFRGVLPARQGSRPCGFFLSRPYGEKTHICAKRQRRQFFRLRMALGLRARHPLPSALLLALGVSGGRSGVFSVARGWEAWTE